MAAKVSGLAKFEATEKQIVRIGIPIRDGVMSEQKNRKGKTGLFAALRDLNRTGRLAEGCALIFAVIASIAELYRSVASEGILSWAISGLVIIMAFLALTFFLFALFEKCIYLVEHNARLSRRFADSCAEIADLKHRNSEMTRLLANARNAEKEIAVYFSDLARAEAAFQTVMLGTMSPDRTVYEAQPNAK